MTGRPLPTAVGDGIIGRACTDAKGDVDACLTSLKRQGVPMLDTRKRATFDAVVWSLSLAFAAALPLMSGLDRHFGTDASVASATPSLRVPAEGRR